MNKIVLGTAQFGLDYGINNKRGKIPQTEVFEILKRAIRFGIDTVDTAHNYDGSEEILGSFMRTYPDRLKVISKLPKCGYSEVRGLLESSLRKLKVTWLYGYLIHSFESFKKEPRIWDELERLKKEGKIKKIGFSFYFPHELEFVLKSGLNIDMVQIPYNIFDQRFSPYFPQLNKTKIVIYARSVFLQGLVFIKPFQLNDYFAPIKNKLEKLEALSQESGVPIFALCLNFVVRESIIDKVVVGIDNIGHLQQIVTASDFFSRSDSIIAQLYNLRIDDEKIILPFNWDMHKVTAQ